VLVAVVGWLVGGRAVWAAQVVTVDRSGSGAVIGVGAALRDAASWRGARTRPVLQGLGRGGWKGLSS
jgi:hypothetical protein